MAIREPRLNVYNSSANPMMILGIVLFIVPFILRAFGEVHGLLRGIFLGLGSILFIAGCVFYVAENM